MRKVEIPDRITQGFSEVWSSFKNRLGVDAFQAMMQPRIGQPALLCIENPFKDFNGFKMPVWKACLDLNELARESWVSVFRQILLFMCVSMFFGACVVVVRKM